MSRTRFCRGVDRECLPGFSSWWRSIIDTSCPTGRRYLDDATYRDTFEAAHSVVLAVFATNKRCTCDVAPWYLTLVLRVRIRSS
jgi:hypothetical protein